MDRRQFVKRAGIGAAATPFIRANHSYEPPAPATVGSGSHRYKVDADWHQDRSVPIKDCHEMVQAPDGRLFLLTNHTQNNVIVYDTSGRVLKTWGTEYPGAHGLTLSEEGGESFLYITDEKTGAVGKHTLDGRKVLNLEHPMASGYYADKAEYKPTETTVGPDGSIYVSDGYGKNYVHRYDAAGRYASSFAGSGNGPAHINCAHGVTLDTRTPTPTLLVTSRGEQSFKRYSLDGQLLNTYHFPNLWVCRPVIKGDYTYAAVIVTDTWYGYDGMVAVFDKDMRLVSAPGSNNEITYDQNGVLTPPKSDLLTFMNPHDVCVDADENLYVPQWYSGRTYPVKLTRV